MSVRLGCTRAPPRRHFSTMHLVAKNGNLLFHFLWIKSIFKNIFVVLLYKKKLPEACTGLAEQSLHYVL